ncbi:Copia protein (Gag-int-pol protein) [Cleaved into: Copia VLP protein [Durusdinium trenchii]|uniref:Copia protein (Gag-int-pol protein) [Cleaved into: Copia VLP protein n=1 Tax=Durusdinium trenchii TaxID=1381693 RepID=A0ABP0IAJ1_9DINO
MAHRVAQTYDNVIQAARKLRHTSEVDLIEIYGGHCNITEEALSRGLRCLQPVGKIHGISLNSKADFAWLQRLLHRWRPLLTVLEPECRLWSPLTGLNYYWRPEELEQLREEAQVTVEGVANMIRDIIAADRFFPLDNPHNGQFWNQPAMLKLFNDFELYYDYGNMCAYGLRGRNGGLICKPTGWLSNNPALLASVTHKCNGLHEHEECMGGNAKLAAVYTKQLAKSLVDAFTSELQDLGDDRFILATSASTPMPGTPAWPAPSTPGPGPMLEDDHVSLQKDPDSWRPLLKEAAERLEGKVAVAAEIKPSAFLEQVKAFYRTPKTRGLPTQRMLNVPDITHRGAALLYHDNTIEVESQALEDLTNPNSRFERSVRVAIFIYGKPMAVETSAQRRTLSKLTSPPTPVAVEPEQTMKPWEPGAADAQASPAALIGARALRCAVCERSKPPREPRPSKTPPPTRRFNERVMLDLLYTKDSSGETFAFLNQVDDATTVQVLTLVNDRNSSTITSALVKGWFQRYGLPETLLVDAEGAMKSFAFDELMAQSNIMVRFAPPDAHWQMGKCERHGDAARAILNKLVDQHGLLGAEDTQTGAVMACFAKNTLARRAGSSPAQWALGQNPRLPAAVLSEGDNPEAMERLTLSNKLQQIENLRFDAMHAFLSFENENALRQSMLRRSRPWRGPYEIGQKVVYYRLRNALDGEGSQPGYRQGLILAKDHQWKLYGPLSKTWRRNTPQLMTFVMQHHLPDFLFYQSNHLLKFLKVLSNPAGNLWMLPVSQSTHHLKLAEPEVPADVPLDPAENPLGNSSATTLAGTFIAEGDAGYIPEGFSGFPRQTSTGLRPVPEDAVMAETGSMPGIRDELPAVPDDEALNVSLEADGMCDTIDAQSLCTFCGCHEKEINDEMNTGKPQCSKCMNTEFTNHPFEVQLNNLDFDARTCSWRPSDHAAADALHLPSQRELEQVWQVEAWKTDEVHRISGDDIPSSTTSTTLKSIAAWEPQKKTWTWLTLAGYVNDEIEDQNFTKKVVLYHTSKPGRRRLSPRALRRQRKQYQHYNPEAVWLLRHGREDALKTGWDGSPKEHQSLFDGKQHFALACNVAEWHEHLDNTKNDHNNHITTFEVYMSTTGGHQVFPETSDEEDAGLKRTQRQALKRELPWRSIGASDWEAFVESMRKEWSEWKKWASCEKFTGDTKSIAKHLILPAQVCFRWKPIDGGASFKAKARIVIQGFRDPHLPLLSRDAPVLSRIGLMCILQWACSHQVDIVNGDCKSAFLQGKPDHERPEKIYMRVPQDGVSREAVPEWAEEPDALYVLHAPVYGQANAPRQWFLHVLDVMVNKLKWVQRSLDPCIFLKKVNGEVKAVLGIHVDDILAASLQEGILNEVEKSFSWGGPWEVNDFVFVARRIVRHDNGNITLSQSHHATDVIIAKVKQDHEAKMGSDRDAISEFRGAAGSLQWMSGTTRPDIAADTSLLQKGHSELTYGDLAEANSVLKYVKATANTAVTIKPIDMEKLVLIAFGDSAFANAPGGKSQGGYIVLASTPEALTQQTDASLLDWKSYRHQRVLRSTLAAEAASLDKSEDYANFAGCMLGEMANGTYIASHSAKSPFAIWPVTDARSLYDAIHRLATSFWR